MRQKVQKDYKRGFVNIFGGLGYFFVTFEWVWAIMLYSSVIESLVKIVSPSSIEDNSTQTIPVVINSSSGPDNFLLVIGAIIAVIMLVLTVYVLVKAPSAVVRTSRKVVHETAEYTTPLVLHMKHRKDTKKNHGQLKPALILIMKIVVVIVPIILTLSSVFLEKQMIDYGIAVYAIIWLAGIATVSYMAQYFLARFLDVKRHELW